MKLVIKRSLIESVAVRKIAITYLMIAISALSTLAQDIHFSQFLQSPLNLNPAQTGNFKGAYRFAGNYRRQWSSVTIPYQTFGVSADARDFKRVKNWGAGAAIYYDQTGDSHFSTLLMNVSSSYRFVFDRRASQYLIVGVQSGITQRRIDYSNLSYDNQYNGFYYDPSIPSMESYANDGRIYPNLNAGLSYTRHFDKRKNINAGIAMFNITKPRQSFFGNNDITLDRRLSVNVNGQFKLDDRLDVLPATLYMAQGTFREWLFGSSIKYIMEDNRKKYRALYAGIWGRARDAGYVSVGMDYDEWFVGLSYDINLSNLRPASYGRGGFEVSVIYIVPEYLPKRLKYKICPDFM